MVEIIPRNESEVGTSVSSPGIIVQNSLPEIHNLKFVDKVYPTNKNIELVWDFFDYDIIARGDLDNSNQSDKTQVSVFRRNSSSESFEKIYVFNDQDNNLQEIFYEDDYTNKISVDIIEQKLIILSDILIVGQQFYVEILPYDIIDNGAKETTSIITVSSSVN